MRITFRNAPVIDKDHKVKISILMVKDADSSIIAQLSLVQVAIQVVNSVRAVAQVRPDRAHGGNNRQRSDQKLFHISNRISFTSYPNTSSASFHLGCCHPAFLRSVPWPEQCETKTRSNQRQRRPLGGARHSAELKSIAVAAARPDR